MNLESIRKNVIIAIFSDEVLVEQLVLKGGNALELVHRVLSRGSVDIDLSLARDFKNLSDIRERIFRALRQRFRELGFVVFDEQFLKVPREVSNDQMEWWGGYNVRFKLISDELHTRFRGNLDEMNRRAQEVDSLHRRTFKIDISKYEYCEGKESAHLDGHAIVVYSVEMCALEKLRAICQQSREYQPVTHKRPRARDFYDIFAIVTRLGIDLSLPENLKLCRNIFAAKRVPLNLLSRIEQSFDFHSADWESVRAAVVGETFDFEFYFQFVLAEIEKLHSLWKV